MKAVLPWTWEFTGGGFATFVQPLGFRIPTLLPCQAYSQLVAALHWMGSCLKNAGLFFSHQTSTTNLCTVEMSFFKSHRARLWGALTQRRLVIASRILHS